MALDANGRPIPVSTPTHPPMMEQPEAVAQMTLNVRKTDDALRQLEDLSRRVLALEQSVYDRLNQGLADFGKRFDEMMLEHMREHERRYETLASIVAVHSAAPHAHDQLQPPP